MSIIAEKMTLKYEDFAILKFKDILKCLEETKIYNGNKEIIFLKLEYLRI